MTKPHYRCIFLIIATHNTEYFKNARKVWKLYMNLFSHIKCFFVYGKCIESLDNKDSNDLIFSDVEENNKFSQIQKSLLAMKYIACNYTYDYIIRTNLSTFWNFNLIENLLQKCPKYMCYAGGHDLSPFFLINPYKIITSHIYSGVCIILTSDIIELFFNNLYKFNFELPDDISLGLFISDDINYNNYTLHNYVNIENYTLLDENIIDKLIINKRDNTIFYRVKNMNNREHTDLMIYIKLLKEIYKINYSTY
jgi:hypothetical protein